MKYKSYIPAVLIALLLILSFFLVRPFLEAILVGALLAYFTYPLYQWFTKKISNPTLSALLVCFIVLLVLLIPAVLILKVLIEQSYTAFTLVQEKLSTGVFTGCTNQICLYLEKLVDNPLIQKEISGFAVNLTTKIFERGSSLLMSIPQILLNIFITFFTIFYFLKGGELFLTKVSNYLSMQKKEYSHILSRGKEIVHGVVYGYLLVAFIQGVLGAIGFFMFGVSSPLFWGVLMGLLALIPFLGTGIIWVPASIVLLVEGISMNSSSLMLKGAGLFLYGLLIVSTIDNILKPKFIGEKAKIHPLIIMLGIFGGLLLFGPLGVIIGPLVLSFTYVVVDIYLSKK